MTDALKAELVRQIAAGEVLVVAGTGVSVAATERHPVASWKGLISHGLNRLVDLGLRDSDWAAAQKKQLDGDLDDLLGAAGQVSHRLGWKRSDPCGGDWNGWLRETVGSLRPQHPELIEALRDLGVPLGTLNYDGLLGEVTGRRPLTWQQAERWLPVLRGADEAILHLHGHWDRPSSVVLGIRSYDAALSASLPQHLQQAFASLHSFLFVGCAGTFADPNLGALLAWMRANLSGAEHRHYLLVRGGESLPVPESDLRDARITPLYYGKDHADLLPFLRSLAPKRSDGSGSVSATGTDHNLPQPNRSFVGRTTELGDLAKLLADSGRGAVTQPRAVTGLGGIGKTQLALTYAYEHLGDYDLVRWLRAEEPSTLAADYAGIAPAVGLDPATADQTVLIAAVRAKLEARDRYLLVFDNATEPPTLDSYLPRSGGGHALITSRYDDWEGRADTLGLAVLPEPDAVALLLGVDTADPAQHPDAAELARALGYLPLVLAQARAFIRERRVSIADYCRHLESARPRVLAWRPTTAAYPLAVAEAWQSSLEQAASDCSGASILMQTLAFFAADAIPRNLLGADKDVLPEGLQEEFDCDDAVAALVRYSLIRADPETIAVHRIVQAVTRDRLDQPTRKASVEAAVRLIKAALPQPAVDHRNWPAIASLLPHALASVNIAEELGVGLEPAATVMNQIALYHHARADWITAEPLLLRAIAIAEGTVGSKHPTLAKRLNNLATLYQAIGRYAEADLHYKRAMSILNDAGEMDSAEFANNISNLADLYQKLGRDKEAEPLFKQAINIGRKHLPFVHRRMATWYNNLGVIYGHLGRNTKARRFIKRAIKIDKQLFGDEHSEIAIDLDNLATVCRDAGWLEEGESLSKQAVAIAERTLGPDHPGLARLLNNLASCYLENHCPKKAEKLLDRAIEIGERSLDHEHPDLAAWLNNRGACYIMEERYADAESFLCRALMINEKRLPVDHPDMLTALENYANLLKALGRHDEAEVYWARAAGRRS